MYLRKLLTHHPVAGFVKIKKILPNFSKILCKLPLNSENLSAILHVEQRNRSLKNNSGHHLTKPLVEGC